MACRSAKLKLLTSSFLTCGCTTQQSTHVYTYIHTHLYVNIWLPYSLPSLQPAALKRKNVQKKVWLKKYIHGHANFWPLLLYSRLTLEGKSKLAATLTAECLLLCVFLLLALKKYIYWKKEGEKACIGNCCQWTWSKASSGGDTKVCRFIFSAFT